MEMSLKMWGRTVGILSALCASGVFGQQPLQPEMSQPATVEPPNIDREREALERSIASANRRYRHETSLRVLLDAAANLPGIRVAAARAELQRVRHRAWLPRLRTTLRRGRAVDIDGPEQQERQFSEDHDLVLEAQLTFDFSALAAPAAARAALVEERNRERLRAERLRAIVELYFERRRLQIERELAPEEPEGRLELDLRILELARVLDLLSGGAFPEARLPIHQ